MSDISRIQNNNDTPPKRGRGRPRKNSSSVKKPKKGSPGRPK